jgi:hypothetical protein
MIYLTNFSDKASVIEAFGGTSEDDLADAKIHLAWYGDGDYCGRAVVIYDKAGQLFWVVGSHCSCNGLEEQWEPIETDWETLRHVRDHGTEFKADEHEGSIFLEEQMNKLLDGVLMQSILDVVNDEIERAVELHGSYNSLHEGYGVMMEEVEEFWEQVKLNPAKLNDVDKQVRKQQLRDELIQVAAVAVRIIKDCGLE